MMERNKKSAGAQGASSRDLVIEAQSCSSLWYRRQLATALPRPF